MRGIAWLRDSRTVPARLQRSCPQLRPGLACGVAACAGHTLKAAAAHSAPFNSRPVVPALPPSISVIVPCLVILPLSSDLQNAELGLLHVQECPKQA